METSRRSFLFGAAAALAAARVPVTIAAPTSIVPLAAGQIFRRRQVFDIMGVFPENAPDRAAAITLWVRDANWLSITLSQRSFWRWVPRPAREFRIDVDHGTFAQIQLLCRDWIDFDDAPMEVAETYTFPQRGAVTALPLHVDNSLKARRARFYASPPMEDVDTDEADRWEQD